jgi:hypothetical protein
MAKIEYMACKEKVEAMLAQDFNPKLIHEKLTEEGGFTMAYSSFTQILRNTERKLPPAKAAPSPADNRQVYPSRPQRTPGIIKTGIEPFPVPRKIDPKTLI